MPNPNHVLLLTWPAPAAGDAATDDAQLRQLNQLAQFAERAEVELGDVLWTMGRFDAVVMLEGEQERVAALSRALSRDGVRTETLPGFDKTSRDRIAEEAGRIHGGDDEGGDEEPTARIHGGSIGPN